jgi:hypothetical protein
MRTGLRAIQYAIDIQHRSAIVVIKPDRCGKFALRDALCESRSLSGSRAIVHIERRTRCREALGHAKNRRHANSTGQQQMMRRFVRYREVIARRADLKPVTFVHEIVHRFRSSPATFIAQYRYNVTVRFGRVIA